MLSHLSKTTKPITKITKWISLHGICFKSVQMFGKDHLHPSTLLKKYDQLKQTSTSTKQ